MSNTSIVLAVGGTLLVVGGAVAFFAFRKKEEKQAVATSIPQGQAAETASEPARRMGLAEALTTIGGKAVTEGIKYWALGPAGYAASANAREQKAA